MLGANSVACVYAQVSENTPGIAKEVVESLRLWCSRKAARIDRQHPGLWSSRSRRCPLWWSSAIGFAGSPFFAIDGSTSARMLRVPLFAAYIVWFVDLHTGRKLMFPIHGRMNACLTINGALESAVVESEEDPLIIESPSQGY